MGLLRTLFIILLVYYGLKFIAKYILPLIITQAITKVQENMKNQYSQQQPQTKAGETSVDFAPKPPSTNQKVGEYIDFEEVDSKTNPKSKWN